MQTRTLTGAVETAGRDVMLYGGMKEIEVDAYFNDVGDAGLKLGVIVARAEYQYNVIVRLNKRAFSLLIYMWERKN